MVVSFSTTVVMFSFQTIFFLNNDEGITIESTAGTTNINNNIFESHTGSVFSAHGPNNKFSHNFLTKNYGGLYIS